MTSTPKLPGVMKAAIKQDELVVTCCKSTRMTGYPGGEGERECPRCDCSVIARREGRGYAVSNIILCSSHRS